MLEAPANPLSDEETRLESGQQRPLRCVVCRRAVTAATERIAVAGAHAHKFSNPTGLSFEIGCFASAPGSISRGKATDLWSWFDGYRWRIAECRGCGVQLGWSFANDGGHGFQGLILAALTQTGG